MRSHDTLQMSASGADVRAPFARIVCGASGTRSSRVAVEQALEVAGGDGTVRFLAISDVSGIGPNRMAGTGTARAERALADARQAARDAGVAASTELCHHADPRRVLVETARASDLLVLGGHVHSRSEGMFLGSAAVYALHAATVPVLVARPVPAGRRLAERVMVAAAGAEGDRHAAQVAAALAARGGGSLTFLHVDGPPAPTCIGTSPRRRPTRSRSPGRSRSWSASGATGRTPSSPSPMSSRPRCSSSAVAASPASGRSRA